VFYYPQLYSFNNNKAAKNMNATAGGLWPGCLAPAWLSFKLSAQLKWNWDKTVSKQFRNCFISVVRTPLNPCSRGRASHLAVELISEVDNARRGRQLVFARSSSSPRRSGRRSRRRVRRWRRRSSYAAFRLQPHRNSCQDDLFLRQGLLKYTWPYVEPKNHTTVCPVVNLSGRPITWHYVGSASRAYYSHSPVATTGHFDRDAWVRRSYCCVYERII